MLPPPSLAQWQGSTTLTLLFTRKKNRILERNASAESAQRSTFPRATTPQPPIEICNRGSNVVSVFDRSRLNASKNAAVTKNLREKASAEH